MKADTFRLFENHGALWLIAEIFNKPNRHQDSYKTDGLRTDELRNRVNILSEAGIVRVMTGSRGGKYLTLTPAGWDMGGIVWEMLKAAEPWPEDTEAYPPRLYIERPGALALLCSVYKAPGGTADDYAAIMHASGKDTLSGLTELARAGLIVGPHEAAKPGAVPTPAGEHMAQMAQDLLIIAEAENIDLSMS